MPWAGTWSALQPTSRWLHRRRLCTWRQLERVGLVGCGWLTRWAEGDCCCGPRWLVASSGWAGTGSVRNYPIGLAIASPPMMPLPRPSKLTRTYSAPCRRDWHLMEFTADGSSIPSASASSVRWQIRRHTHCGGRGHHRVAGPGHWCVQVWQADAWGRVVLTDAGVYRGSTGCHIVVSVGCWDRHAFATVSFPLSRRHHRFSA